MNFLASIVLVLGIVVSGVSAKTPDLQLTGGTGVSTKAPNWQLLGIAENFILEIDLNSLKRTVVNGGAEIFSITRIVYPDGKIFNIKGKDVLGLYSLTASSVLCKEDRVLIHISSLFDAKSNILDSKEGVSLPNPHNDSFTSAFFSMMCGDTQNTKPAPTI
jgi:hypothetical protein